MAATYYYRFPFGTSADDLTAIPTDIDGAGAVSYEEGWTDRYELDLLTDPQALPIPRGQMNQLFLDITKNVQEYQQFGTPNFITTSDNGGSPFPYPVFARVYLAGEVYESQVAANITTPPDSSWLRLSGNAQGVPVGTVIDFAGAVAPSGYLICDGTAVSRSTFARLLSKITIAETGSVTNTSPIITGLSSTADLYPGMKVEGIDIPAGTAILTVDSGTQVTLDTPATGTDGAELVTFYLWGNGNNSTTFNVPDLRRYTTIGKFGTGSVLVGNKVGQRGGSETHAITVNEMPAHTHQAPGSQQFLTTGSGSFYGNGGLGTDNTQGQTASRGGGVASTIMQPSAVMNKCIKF